MLLGTMAHFAPAINELHQAKQRETAELARKIADLKDMYGGDEDC